MTEFILQYWLQAVFGGIIIILGWVVKKIKQQKKEQDAIKLGVQALLRDRIIQSYYHYTEKKYITLHGLENVNKMYEEYHNLGGNGSVTKLVEDMRKLNVIDD